MRTGESCYRAADVPELIYKVNEQWATGCYPFLNPIRRGQSRIIMESDVPHLLSSVQNTLASIIEGKYI